MDENRRLIFLEELAKLRNARLIPDREYEKLKSLHEWHRLNVHQPSLPGEDAQSVTAVGAPTRGATIDADVSHPYGQPLRQQPNQPPSPPPSPPQTQSPPRPTRVFSPQDIRDRNITWVLVLGVLFVLLAGLILATSSWNMMGNVAKTGSIAFVALLFFGLSVFTDKTLKIKKTGFAFWVLGSLFLPVAILSAGFFELFGSWLSVSGEGRFVLGVLGASVCIPVYAYSSNKYANRFFTWLTLVTISLDVVFLIAAFHPPIDLFYLGVVLYNALIVSLYATKALPEKLSRFSQAFPAFVQINLFISTLFLLTFYAMQALHGINLLLMAVLYILMTFSGGRKESGIVFSGLLVFGIWYVVKSSPLASLDMVLFALIGFLFLGFERAAKDREFLRKTFVFASGFVSLCTFLFINLRGMFLNTDTASFAMLAAHLLVAANYGYLAFRTKRPVFSWLTPLFLISAGQQGFNLIASTHSAYSYPLHMFLLSVLMFVFLFLLNRWKPLLAIRASHGVLSLLLMTFAAGMATAGEEWGLASLAFATLAGALYLVYRKEERRMARTFLRIVFPLLSVLSLATLYGILPLAWDAWYGGARHFGCIVLLLFLVSVLFRKLEPSLEKPFFWAAHTLLPLSVWVLSDTLDDNPLIFLIPAVLYFHSLWREFTDRHRPLLTCGFLYLMYTACVLALFSAAEALKMPNSAFGYLLPVAGLVLAVLWLLLKNEWRIRTFWYFIPISVLAIISLLSSGPFTLAQLIVSMLCVVLMLVVMHGQGRPQLVFIPLLLLMPIVNESFWTLLDNRQTAQIVTLVILFLLLKQTGEFLFRGLCDRDPEAKGLWSILPDWYAVGALAVLPYIGNLADGREVSPWLTLIAPSLLTFLLFSQRHRVGDGKKIVHTLWIVSVMLPYLAFLSVLDPPRIIETELFCLPLLVITLVLSVKVWPGREVLFRKIQLAVLLGIAALLLHDVLRTGDITDALITGVLSLVSVFVGMQLRIKSYFFVGSGTLLLNTLIQTQAFWASIPWWGYLLIAGLALIAIASLNEMQKGERETPPKFSKQAVLEKFKRWR